MTLTNEQTVNIERQKIDQLKSDYQESLQLFIDKKNSNVAINVSDVQYVHTIALKYYNYAENYVGNSGLLGAHKDDFWVTGFAEDCFAILESLIKHYDFIESYKELLNETNSYPKPSATSYANMQRMVVLCINPEEVTTLKKTFKQKKLPIYGFSNEAKHIMNKKTQTILSFSFGVAFLIILLTITVLIPSPTQFQQNIFWVILSLAGAGAVATLPGFIEIKFGNWLRAGGALAVFAFIYSIKPASDHESKLPLNVPTSIEMKKNK